MENNNTNPRLSLVICTLNEASNVEAILTKIPDYIYEVILVDGHSSDGTVDIARKIFPRARIFYQPGKGKGDALKCGYKNATGDIIITLDADGATDPALIPEFIQPLMQGYDFVKGSRFLHGPPLKMSFVHKFGNWVLTTTANILYRAKYTDICSGYNAFWKKSIDKIKLENDGFEMEQEFNVKIKKAGLKVTEVYCLDKGRIGGRTKVSTVKQGLKDWWIIIKERFHA